MKVLDCKVTDSGEIWFKVELVRNTEVLAKELFTADDVKEFQKQEVGAFLDNLYDKWVESN